MKKPIDIEKEIKQVLIDYKEGKTNIIKTIIKLNQIYKIKL